MHRTGILFLLILIMGTRQIHAADAAFFVAPDGSDRNDGTATKPFATPGRARDAVRERIKAGLIADVTVLFRGGTYELKEPLILGPEDSGTNQFSITYMAHPGEKPVISGGRKITGWKKGQGQLWTADLPDVKAGRRYFRQLFVNGKRAIRARTPNVDEKEPYWQLSATEKTQLTVAGKPVAWRNLNDVEVVVFLRWEIMRKRLASVDEAGAKLRLAEPCLSGVDFAMPEAGHWCYVENALEMLDRPGEWYLDRTTGVLSYWPRQGEDMARAEVVAPALTQLLGVLGTPERPVRNVVFKGLSFAHFDWPLPEMGYYGMQACFYNLKDFADHPTHIPGTRKMDAAIRWTFAQGCRMEDCEIAHLDGVGIGLGAGCWSNLVQGCRIFDIGATGIMVGEYDCDKYAKGGGYAAPPAEVARGNRVANNHIYACGVTYPGCHGIWVGMTDGTVVSHNLLHDLPYSGMQIGNVWSAEPTDCKNNLIEFNHVHHVTQLLQDGAGIYTLGNQSGTVLRGNLVHDADRSAYAVGPASCNGLYFDSGSSGFMVEGNVVYNTPFGKPMFLNNNNEASHTWRDNSFGVAPDDPKFPKENVKKAGLESPYRERLAEQ